METKTKKNLHKIMFSTHDAKLNYPIFILLFCVIARLLLLYDPRPEVSTSTKVCLQCRLYIHKLSAEVLNGSYS